MAVVTDPVNVTPSRSASVADTDPDTTPVPAFVVDTETPATGTVLDGLTWTGTRRELVAPYLSVTVTAKLSVLSAASAPVRAAVCRAVAVGV